MEIYCIAAFIQGNTASQNYSTTKHNKTSTQCTNNHTAQTLNTMNMNSEKQKYHDRQISVKLQWEPRYLDNHNISP